MSKIFLTVAVLLLSMVSGASPASPVYVNNNIDTANTVLFSNGYTQIGDQLRLTGASQLDSLVTQFFNLGGAASFDATLSFYRVDTLAQIGSSFTETGIAIGAGQSLNVAFAHLGGFEVPEDVVVMLSIRNLLGAGDLGLNLFDPPTVGSSSNQSFFVNTGAGLMAESTFQDTDNVYFEINSTTTHAVPVPGTLWLLLGPAMAVLCWRQRLLGRRATASQTGGSVDLFTKWRGVDSSRTCCGPFHFPKSVRQMKVSNTLAAALGLLAMMGATQATQMTAVDNGLGVLDSDTHLEWTADMNLAGGKMTWYGANDWIANLNASNYAGHSDWRLPTLNPWDTTCSGTDPNGTRYGYNCAGGELSHLFVAGFGNQANQYVPADPTGHSPEQIANLALFSNVQFGDYWSGTSYLDNRMAWIFRASFGSQTVQWKNYQQAYAVAVRDVPAAVPEPETYVMLLVGLGALALIIRRRAR